MQGKNIEKNRGNEMKMVTICCGSSDVIISKLNTIMHELYQKIWNGNNWVKDKK